ncbi:putative signal transducing protein [Flavicella marina]|uniref:putative signal transducing protein n=1 Tax=Flavicella marina TaxID=1475951 RepID=UPI0012653AF3|nr:DUF2007 domain-containing protein [Flavicella marina]
MTNNSNHVKLHTASFIEIQRLQLDLNDAEIPFLTKNNDESARLAGFGSFGDHVELYVYENDIKEATEILEKLKTELI